MKVFRALADPSRLRVVAALMAHDELCACQLIELLGFAGATVSRHLAVLVNAGLVASRKDGRWVHYRLCRRPEFAGLLDWLGTQAAASPVGRDDLAALARITAADPGQLCRRQRGAKCC